MKQSTNKIFSVIFFSLILFSPSSYNDKVSATEIKNTERVIIENLNNPPKYSDKWIYELMDEPIGNAECLDLNSPGEDPKVVVELNRNKNESGAIYSKLPLDLTKDFTLKSYLYLGSGGASGNSGDGITFVLQNDLRMISDKKQVIGGSGQLLGAMGRARIPSGSNWLPKIKEIQNALMIEFDAYHNGCGTDDQVPFENDFGHIAWRSGKELFNPKSNLRDGFGPSTHNDLQLPFEKFNNDTWRSFDVSWSATTKQLTYQLHANEEYPDNGTIEPVIIDLSNYETIFNGSTVYWGFTGANGVSVAHIRASIYEIPQKKLGSTKVRYIDVDTGKNIEGETEINEEGLVGLSYDYSKNSSIIKEITNYELVKIPENISGIFEDGTITIDVLYKRKTKKISIKYVDENNSEIVNEKLPTTIEEKLGTDFSIKIPSLYPIYEWVSVENADYLDGTLTGTLSESSKDIIMYYKKLPDKVNVIAEAYFLNSDIPIKHIEGVNKGENITFHLKDIPVSSDLEMLIVNSTDLFKSIKNYHYTEKYDLNNQVLVPPIEDVRVKVFYEGILQLKEATSQVTFGQHKLISSGIKKHFLDDQLSISILDTRQGKIEDWVLYLNLIDGLSTSNQQNNKPLKGSLKVKMADNNFQEITEKPIEVYSKLNDKPGVETVDWYSGKGAFIEQLPGNIKETYTGKLKWTLVCGP